MRAADLMSRSVMAIGEEAPLSQAVRLMIEGKISGLPVLDREGWLVGIVTEGDLLRRVETGTGFKSSWIANFFAPGRQADRYIQTHGRRVRDVMTPEVITVDEDTTLQDVVNLMERRRVKRLPVLREGRMVGIISRADIVRALEAKLRASVETEDDADIIRRIQTELMQQPWAHPHSVTIACENGVVLLDGCVFDLRERMAMGVLAENIPGVKKVENRLACIEPNTGMLIYNPPENNEGAPA